MPHAHNQGSDNTTVEEAGGSLCINGAESVDCKRTSLDGESCLDYTVTNQLPNANASANANANATSNTTSTTNSSSTIIAVEEWPDLDVTIEWSDVSAARAMYDPRDPAPKLRWVAASSELVDSGTANANASSSSGVTFQSEDYPLFGFEDSFLDVLSRANAERFEYIVLHVALSNIEYQEWVLVSSNELFATKIHPVVLDMLSLGSLNYKVNLQ